MTGLKTNKGKRHSDEVGIPEVGALMGYHSSSKTGSIVNYKPKQKKHQQEESSITGPNRKTYSLHLLQEISNLAMRNRHHPELSLFSSGLGFKTASLSFLLSLCKTRFLPLLCLWDLPMAFAIACLSWIAILPLFLNKRFLLEKKKKQTPPQLLYIFINF